MKKISQYLALIVLTVIVSCEKEYSCEGCADNNNNKPPISVAGPDQVITLPTDSVSLDGRTSSDPDGMISSYLWTKISGPASFTISKPADSITKVRALVTGTYQFELKVTDDGGLSAKDTMRVIVDSVVTANHPPIANAGADQIITLPTNIINLDASGSSDPENNITSYQWTKISGPTSFNIVNSTAIQTQLTNLNQGIYQLEVKVTDAFGLFSKDTMQVIVNTAVANNLAPVAKAGNDTTIQSNQSACAALPAFTLNGSSSYDPDGTIVNYLWTGSGVITNANSAIATVNGLMAGINTFILKVTDNNGAVAYDTIQVTILIANRPLIPAQLISIGTLSQTRWGFSVAAAGNKILFAGGLPPGNSPATASVDIYDISSGIWTTSQLSEARLKSGVAVLGNKIFFGGGMFPEQNAGGTWMIWNFMSSRSSAVDIYDVSTASWSTAQLGRARCPAGASTANKVFFAGGEATFPVFNNRAFDTYDAGSNTWLNVLLPNAGALRQPVVAGNKIYYAGGLDDGSIGNAWNIWSSKRIDIYDASSNSWSTDSLSEERAEIGSILANNKIFWAGGYVWNTTWNDYSETNVVEIRDLTSNTTSFDCLSEAKAGLTAVRKDNKIIFFGGYNSTRFDIYDLTTNSWSIGVLPQNLHWASIISHNNVLYVSGGQLNGVYFNQVWKLEF